MKRAATVLLMFLLGIPAMADELPTEGHPSLLPAVTADSEFPLYTSEDLLFHGYPDHQHEFFWPGWTSPVDEHGHHYGFGTFCQGLENLDREGLESAPGHLQFPPFTMSFNDTVAPCYVAPFLGLCEMALHDVCSLLQLEPAGELHMNNPDDVATYTALTGQGIWRMFRRDGDAVVLQPVGILARRTLIAHAARDLVLQWVLAENGGEGLPVWLKQGLATWFAELGVHLNNYMAAERIGGSPLLDPEQIDAILSGPLHQDQQEDRRLFRSARYSAFLMVWHLVEHRGGLESLRELLHAVRDGEDPDQASKRIYGVTLVQLRAELDPRGRTEPLGDNVVSRNPAQPPR